MVELFAFPRNGIFMSNGKIAFGGYLLAGADMERSSFVNTRRLDAEAPSMQGAPAR